MKPKNKCKQSGVVIIEFALSFVIFWLILLAIIEFCRAMFAWNSALEATRLGSRLASICSMDNGQQNKIRDMVKYYIASSGMVINNLDDNWLEFIYYPPGCDISSCTSVESKLSEVQIKLLIPINAAMFTLPEFRHVVLRESLSNTIKYANNTIDNNEVCD